MFQTYHTTLNAKTQLTNNTFLFHFSIPEGQLLEFKSGQYMILHVPTTDEHPIRRMYSIASSPSKTTSFDLLIECMPNGKAGTFLQTLKIGDSVKLQGPAGMFVLNEVKKPVIMIATGTGFAPMYSIIQDMFIDNHEYVIPSQPFHLLWGMPVKQEIYMLKELKEIAEKNPLFSFQYCLSRETNFKEFGEDEHYFISGRVSLGLEKYINSTSIDELNKYDYYLCGGHTVVEGIKNHLYDIGIEKENVHFEKFV
ncbi:MAG: FAD-dependent oxidoreductase [Candidatus Roizmanbacteria bacterium]